MFFDSHAHYDDEKFTYADRDKLISRLFNENVSYILNSASDLSSSRAAISLAEKYPYFYASAGIHPHECGKYADIPSVLNGLTNLLKHDKVRAIGEIGLDYHYDFSPRDVQIKWFKAQMELARELDMPVIIHDREAHGQCMDIVNEYPEVRGVFHSYSGSAEMAQELLKRGWYISFSGSVTFKNANKLLDAVKAVPDDRILIETDAPYLAPVPVRGTLNHSGNLAYTAQKIAEIRETDVEHIADITLDNAKNFFEIR